MRVKDYGSRKDANHRHIQRAFEQHYCRVKDVSGVPGFVDLVVKLGSQVRLVEIKDPNQPPSQRKLTVAEDKFWKYWGEDPLIVETYDDVRRVVEDMRFNGVIV